MIADDVVLSVAPRGLRTYRRIRCRGDESAVSLSAFPPRERETIAALYELLGELADALRDGAVVATERRRAFRDRIANLLRHHDASVTESIAEALHDVRGGAMTALLIGLGETPMHRGTEVSTLSALVRDQRKIIRNIVRDVDPAGLARDAADAPHSLADLAAGMASFAGPRSSSVLSVTIHRETDATVATSCLEFALLERAVFNLLNNAARHAHGDEIEAWLLAIDGNARIAIVNSVTPPAAALLTAELDRNPAALYGRFSTTGSGLGLGIVADIVCNAYGLGETEELVSEGYVGTRVVDDIFVAWLHWPLSE